MQIMHHNTFGPMLYFHINVQKIQNLDDEKLLKLSLLACVYGSLDLSFYCLSHYDKRHASSFGKDWMLKH